MPNVATMSHAPSVCQSTEAAPNCVEELALLLTVVSHHPLIPLAVHRAPRVANAREQAERVGRDERRDHADGPQGSIHAAFNA